MRSRPGTGSWTASVAYGSWSTSTPRSATSSRAGTRWTGPGCRMAALRHPRRRRRCSTRSSWASTADGGWPAFWGGDVASIDATCFRLAELDDLGALEPARPRGGRCAGWRPRSGPTACWEEDAVAGRRRPAVGAAGRPRGALYLTANAAFWLAVGGPSAEERRPPEPSSTDTRRTRHPGGRDDSEHAARSSGRRGVPRGLRPDGTWPSFLVSGWLGGAVLLPHRLVLRVGADPGRARRTGAGRCPRPTSRRWLAALRRVGMSDEDSLLAAARRRLAETQRTRRRLGERRRRPRSTCTPR